MSYASKRHLTAARVLTRCGVILANFALALLLVFHQQVPDVAGLGLVIDNLAPWLGLGIVLLAFLAMAVGGRGTYLMLLVPLLAWAMIFGQDFLPAPERSSHMPLVVATQNVHEQEVTVSARILADSGAQVITLQELGAGQDKEINRELATSHPHHFSVGTVGVWSSYPIRNVEPLDLGLGWNRALRLDLDTASGPVRFYAVHAASARPTGHTERDMMLARLSDYIRTDNAARIIAAGDFNATSTDRHFAPLAGELDEITSSSWGMSMTWPRSPFPMLRIDHVMGRGTQPVSLEQIAAGESDHYAIVAEFDLAGQ